MNIRSRASSEEAVVDIADGGGGRGGREGGGGGTMEVEVFLTEEIGTIEEFD